MDFLGMLTAIGEWIDRLRGMNRDKLAQSKAALQALVSATIKTTAYLANVRRGAQIERDRESTLAQLWSEASIELREINPDLAERCFIKAEYWADPEQWTDTQIQEARIGIESIKDEAQLLYREG